MRVSALLFATLAVAASRSRLAAGEIVARVETEADKAALPPMEVELKTRDEFDKFRQMKYYDTAIVAFISHSCGHCTALLEDGGPWGKAVAATKEAKGVVRMVLVDVSAGGPLEDLAAELNIKSTPTVKIYRRGVLPTLLPGKLTEESLLTLVSQMTMKNALYLRSEEGVDEFLNQSRTPIAKGEFAPAYILVSIGSKLDGQSFSEVAGFAHMSGALGIKYAVCGEVNGSVMAKCGVARGQARLLRGDLPEKYKKKGIMMQKPLSETRAFHIFSRGGILQPFMAIAHPETVQFINAATIPVLSIIYNEQAELDNVVGGDSALLTAMGWDYMGRVALTMSKASWARQNIALWRDIIPAEDDNKAKYPRLMLCKFMTSPVCYHLHDADLTGFLPDGEEVPQPGETVVEDAISGFLDAYLEGALTWMPRSEAVDAYDHITDVPTNMRDSGVASTIAHVVGSTYKDFVEDDEVDRFMILTKPKEICPSCVYIDHSFQSIANVSLQKSSSLTFGIMDCSKNDPPEDLEVHQFPKIIFYKRNQQKGQSMLPSQMFPHVRELLQEHDGLIMGWKGDKNDPSNILGSAADAPSGKFKKKKKRKRRKQAAKMEL